MKTIYGHIRFKLAKYFVLAGAATFALLAFIFCFQIKISTDRAITMALAGVNNHLRLVSETVHLGYVEFEEDLLKLIKEKYHLTDASIVSEPDHQSCLIPPYEIQGFTICWKRGHIEADSRLQVIDSNKFLRVSVDAAYLNTEIFLSLLVVFLVVVALFVVIGTVFARTIKRDVIEPIICLNESLVTQCDGWYLGSIKELANLAKAINLSRKKILEHITAETLRWVAHDLKKPIHFAFRFAQRFGALDERSRESYVKENLHLLMLQLNSAKSTIDDLQDAGIEPILKREVIPIGAISEEIRQHLGSKVIVKDLSSEIAVVSVDRNKMLRALKNILFNALEACSPKAGDKIYFRVERNKTSAIFKIMNTGSFISKENMPFILREFFSSNKKDGRGMGLAISQRIIDAHGGSVYFESNGISSDGKSRCIGQAEIGLSIPKIFVDRSPHRTPS